MISAGLRADGVVQFFGERLELGLHGERGLGVLGLPIRLLTVAG